MIVDSDPEARSAVRRELRPRGFGVVLVDKDGRVALRRPTPLSVRDIARAIDRTPLRREELRYGGKAPPADEEAGESGPEWNGRRGQGARRPDDQGP